MTSKRKQAKHFHFNSKNSIGMQDPHLRTESYYETVDENGRETEVSPSISEYEADIVDIDTVRRRLGLISTAELAPEEPRED